MIRNILAASLLVLAAQGAQAAATSYVLSSITYANAFTGATVYTVGGNLAGTCTGCGTSMAVDDGFGNITLTDVAWSANAFGQAYDVSFDATTTLSTLTQLNKTDVVCNNISGAVCDPASNKSGLSGAIDYSGLAMDGITACAACAVNVTTPGAGLLKVEIRKQLSEGSAAFQAYSLNYTVVPVPAAVWLFGSALGLLGIARRKVMAR